MSERVCAVIDGANATCDCFGECNLYPGWDNPNIVHPVSLYGPEFRAYCETYLRVNGWDESALGWHNDFSADDWGLSFTEALDLQWVRDGIGSAT